MMSIAVSSFLFLLLGCIVFNANVGMAFVVNPLSSAVSPSRCIDGTSSISMSGDSFAEQALASYPFKLRTNNNDSDKKHMMDITQAQALAAYEELARLYGEEEAVEFVKIQPLALATNSDNFAQQLDIWSEKLGSFDTVKGMVSRNPSLLLMSPKQAELDAFGAFGYSYIIWATRPLITKLAIAGSIFYQYSTIYNSEEGLPDWLLHASDGL